MVIWDDLETMAYSYTMASDIFGEKYKGSTVTDIMKISTHYLIKKKM